MTVGMLVASGMSTVGAIAMVAIDPLSGALREGSQAMLRWRVVGGALSGAASLIRGWADVRAGGEEISQGYLLTGALYIVKGVAGLAAGGGFLVSAISSSYRLIQSMGQRSFGGRIAVIVVEGVASTVGRSTATCSVLVTGGRFLLCAAGWKVTVALFVVEGVIWYFTPNAMERWLDKTMFGSKRRFAGVEQQQEEFDEMLGEMGYR